MKNSNLQLCEMIINTSSVRLQTHIEGVYYLEYRVNDSKALQVGTEMGINTQSIIQFNEVKKLAFPIKKEDLQKIYLLISLFIKSQQSTDNERSRDQLAGRLSVPLTTILMQNQYEQQRQHPFQMNSFNSYITFCCKCLGNDLNSIISQKNNTKRIQILKKDETASLYIGENSYSPPSQHNESRHSRRSLHTKSWEELLANQASFQSQQNMLTKIDNSSALEERIKKMEKVDLEVLLKENYRLERLLYISRNQRNIQNGRHEQELKDIARQLSLKQAEIIKLREEFESVNERVGQLLDECEGLTKEKQQKERVADNEKRTSEKLEASHESLASRVKQLCLQNQKTIIPLREELANATKIRLQLEEQSALLKQKAHTLQFQKQSLQKRLQQSNQLNHQLQQQIKSKDEIVKICKQYEQKLSQLEEKIDSIEGEGEFVHRNQYYSYGTVDSSDQIKIEDDDSSLRRIVEEELEESLSLEEQGRNSQDYLKSSPQICTATTLLEPQRNQLELLQLLTQNLQRQHDHLKYLYREQEVTISYKDMQFQTLEKELSQLRFQFLLELSRVTAQMNQQILENRSIREHNLKLQKKLEEYQLQTSSQNQCKGLTLYHTTHSKSSLHEYKVLNESQREDYLKRIKKLEEDNQNLLKYNLQREELYEMIMGEKSESEDLIFRHFENSLKYILEHRQKYASLLKNIGLCEQFTLANQNFYSLDRESQQQPQLKNCQGNTQNQSSQLGVVRSSLDNNISDIINNFNPNHKVESDSQIHKFDVFSSSSQDELLIESTARPFQSNPFPTQSIQTVLSELIQLFKQRQQMSAASFKKDKYHESIQKEELKLKLKRKVQAIKALILKSVQSSSRLLILTPLRDLQADIDQYSLT